MHRRPSPALVLSFLALLGAWGGPAVARSLIRSPDIADHTIRGRDVRSNTITGRNVAGLSGRDVVPNGLDGSDIDEGSLDAVPNAAHADAADVVSGVSMRRFAYADPTGESKVFLDEAGLKITGACRDGDLEATAAPTAPGGLIRVALTTPTAPTQVYSDNDFKPGETLALLPGELNDASGTLTWYEPGGDTLTVQYLAQDGLAAGTGHQCVIAGTAVHAKK